ncbi:MAG: biotin carboxyl carrier protein [Bacteriovoracaceae bacterium]|jgi:biotin carboxyl carrier protein
MRTYLIDNDKSEIIIDLTRTIVHSHELVEFEYSAVQDNEVVQREQIFIRKLAGRYFASNDNKRWTRLAKQHLPTHILNVDQVYKVFRGYKPSGLSGGDDGELLTQMPGKVVKILVKNEQEVKAGETVIILEAMKMENEIKSAVDGIVKEIHVKEGDALDQGVLMLEIEAK